MHKLSIEFSDWADLQQQLEGIATTFGDRGALVSVNQQADGSGQMSLALFSDDELTQELQRREKPEQSTAAPASTQPAADVVPIKRGRGRPPKAKPEQVDQETGEVTPTPAATPAVATKPDTDPAAVEPELPSEDAMLELMSELYSVSGDMELVRGIMKSVGGQTQLSRIPVQVWPALKAQLSSKLSDLKKAMA